MPKDLTHSELDRQNVLNNPYALAEIEKAAGLQGIHWRGKTYVLKSQVASFFEVDSRTIENYLQKNSTELQRNGYVVLSGKELAEMKLAIQQSNVSEIDFGNIKMTPQLGVFDFRAFLNLAMLISESQRAAVLRKIILDIAIDTINIRTGGGTKYINQRDDEFLYSFFEEENYRKQFTDALDHCVEMGKIKYAIYTDKIYVSIFKEKAKEYRNVLKLSKRDKVRDTFYSEVLDLISAFETGLAEELEDESKRIGRKLRPSEVDQLFKKFESKAHWKPLVEKARNKMASRDLVFREALHLQLKEYVTPLQREEFERFLGEKSKELGDRMEEAKDVMKRLKERE